MKIEKNPTPDRDAAWLDAGLEGLRRQLLRLGAPVSVERSLLAQFRASQMGSRPSPVRLLLQQFLLPAVALGGAVVISLSFLLKVSTPADLGTQTAWTAPSMSPFYALARGEAQPTDADGIVVPTEVSSQTLQDFGLPVDPSQVGQPVKAEVLVGTGGEIIGVRLSDERDENR